MGIADFTIDSPLALDRVLVISESEGAREELLGALRRRAYELTAVSSAEAGSEAAASQLFDLVVLNHEAPPALAKALEAVRAQPPFRRIPVVVLSSEEVSQEELGEDVRLVRAPWQPSDLLVKVAMTLRLRKLRSEELSSSSQLAEQNAQLRDLTTRFQRELKEAQSIQQTILPKDLPVDERCRFAARYLPLEAVGGDLYDIWKIDSERYGLFLGDVTGHGLPAALIGAMTKMALSYARKIDSAAMLNDMNAGIAAHMPEGRFVAVTAAIFNAESGALSVSCGGNPTPLIYRARATTVEQVKKRGLPLGVAAEVPYQSAQTTLERGDKLLMVSDGLVETASMDNELLGTERLVEVLARRGGSPIPDIIDAFLRFQSEFAGGRIFKDDNTIVGVERL